MAILPIDLQTLYSQMEKVGKTQVHQQLAAQVAQEAKMVANRTLSEHKLKSVQETEAGSEQTGVVHERDGEDNSQETGSAPGEKRDNGDKGENAPEPKKEVIRDLALGNNIDITG